MRLLWVQDWGLPSSKHHSLYPRLCGASRFPPAPTAGEAWQRQPASSGQVGGGWERLRGLQGASACWRSECLAGTTGRRDGDLVQWAAFAEGEMEQTWEALLLTVPPRCYVDNSRTVHAKGNGDVLSAVVAVTVLLSLS